MGRRLLIVGGCALLLTGCGGEKKQEAEGGLYHRGPVAACLRSHDFRVSLREQDVNFVAYTATGGALRAWQNGTHDQVSLILAFGATNDDAKQTLRAMQRFALRPPIFRWRARRANAVILFAYRPSLRNQQLLLRCLNTSVRS